MIFSTVELLLSRTGRAGTGRLAGLAWPATGGRPMSRTFPQANAGRLKRGSFRRKSFLSESGSHSAYRGDPPLAIQHPEGFHAALKQPFSCSDKKKKKHLLRVTTPNTNKHLLASQTRDGDRLGKLRYCRRQRNFQSIQIHLTLVLDGALE